MPVAGWLAVIAQLPPVRKVMTPEEVTEQAVLAVE